MGIPKLLHSPTTLHRRKKYFQLLLNMSVRVILCLTLLVVILAQQATREQCLPLWSFPNMTAQLSQFCGPPPPPPGCTQCYTGREIYGYPNNMLEKCRSMPVQFCPVLEDSSKCPEDQY